MTAWPEPERWDDFALFARHHVESLDVDPVYPVLRRIYDALRLDDDDRLALALIYVALYDLPSALALWLDGWRIGRELPDDVARRPIGTERRGHRAPDRLRAHFDSLVSIDRTVGLRSWLHPGPGLDGRQAWRDTFGAVEAITGNGRWAAFKTCEVLASTLGWPLTAPDAGHAHSTGPRKGLTDLWPSLAGLDRQHTAEVVAVLDRRTDDLVDRLGLPVELVETILCDWHSTLSGHYYVGHDIDQMLGQTARIDRVDVASHVLAARAASFDPRYLGELGDRWAGVRPGLRRLYVDEGRITWWEES